MDQAAEDEALALMNSVLQRQPAIGGKREEKANVGTDKSLSFQVPNSWTLAEGAAVATGTDADGFSYSVWPGLADPVNGLVTDEVKLLARPTTLTSVEELGKPERINFAKAYGITADLLVRADVLTARVRRLEDGQVFYDWDLSCPPAECPKDGEWGNAPSCNSEAAYFVSSTVKGGELCLMTVRVSTRKQWESNALALKDARTTFAVGPAQRLGSVIASLPDPVPGAGTEVIVAAP